ncbi:hypothetical protein QTP86_031471, partial [Hemibagrus guttatus]
IDTFPGKCFHSWEYKDPHSFHGKRVVVIGTGNSGGDIAVEISRVAEKVGCELEEKERFWSELDEVMESIPTGERVVIGADFNGHVGEGNRGDEEVMGKLMNEENEREKRVEGVNSVEQKVDKIIKDEVRKALKRMKSGKAVGPDDIPVEFLTSLFKRVLENLEKAYDRGPREELWYCMRKSGVAEKYVRVVQDMYERSRTVVRCAVGQTEEFKVEVGLHQGSALSPFLFAIVMDQLSEEVRQESPWTMMFADDIVICSESREQVEESLERWRFALERRGMKVSRSKTEHMCVNEREGSGTVRLQGEEVKKVQEFKYLGSTVQSNGECGKEVKKRVQAGWNGWRKVSGVLCDRKISVRIKGKVYRTVVRPAMLYGLETEEETGVRARGSRAEDVETFLSMREGTWVVGRMSTGGLPLDMNMVTRLNALLLQVFPQALLNWALERSYNQKYNHKLYGLQPRHRILSQRPVINDDLPGRILQGALQLKPNVREFQVSTVVFDNEAFEEGVDAVVFCTGYKASFPFLLPSQNSDPVGKVSLYKRVFPLSLECPTLAFIGLINTMGPLMPVMEMQARWATRVFAGLNQLPPVSVMHKITEKDRKANMKRYSCPQKAALEVDYIPYLDSIAQEIGVRPNLLWLFLTDPGLGFRVLFGPCTPYQFRLSGPGRWDGARQAILTQWDRVAQPFKTRPIPEDKTSTIGYWLGLAGWVMLIFALLDLQKRNKPFFSLYLISLCGELYTGGHPVGLIMEQSLELNTKELPVGLWRESSAGGGCPVILLAEICTEVYPETPEAEHSSIYRSLVLNTSKEMTCFSDFPMPAHYPNYMHHSMQLKYLRLYAEHFDLLKYIRFQTTVLSVRQRHDFSDTGQWEVVTEDRDGHRGTQVFDAVLVCSGSFTHPVTPLSSFPGIDTFPGKCFHSWEYKDPHSFHGKRVVVIGTGNSGGDIAVEISRVAEKTFLSMREGTWVLGRMSTGGLPLDMNMVTRLNALLLQVFPQALLNWAVERSYNQKYNHKLYGLQPRHRILSLHPTINDDLPGRLLQGALQVKPNVREFRGSTVVFDNEAVEEGVDAVVFCTGYKASFPFLLPSQNSDPVGKVSLYKRVFPLSLEHPTLAFIGLINAMGPLMPVMEMQARWATRVFAGLNQLPPVSVMHKITEKDRKANMKRYSCPQKAALEVDYIPYLDSIAQEIGVRPNLLWLFLTDPGLGFRVLFGPCTPYQFRLSGPGRWDGARQAILTQWDRVAQPFKTRPIPEDKTSTIGYWLGLAGGVMLIFALLDLQKRNKPFFSL